jgi:hypothetical protein
MAVHPDRTAAPEPPDDGPNRDDTTPSDGTTPDAEGTAAFGRRLLDLLTGHALTTLIGIGHRTGLFDALAPAPATGPELAARAGLHERYVREWLAGLVTGGVLDHDPATGRYRLPPAHAPLLTGERAANIGPAVGTLDLLASVRPGVERCFAEGGGVPYATYAATAERVGVAMGDSRRYLYDEHLLDGFLGAVPGLLDRLAAGARVLDLGCGTGQVVCLLAAAFPASVRRGGSRPGRDRPGRGRARPAGPAQRGLRRRGRRRGSRGSRASTWSWRSTPSTTSSGPRGCCAGCGRRWSRRGCS